MGRISGWLWIVGAAGRRSAGTFLPGAEHEDVVWVLLLSALVLAYGIGSVTGVIPWQRASTKALALGMVVTSRSSASRSTYRRLDQLRRAAARLLAPLRRPLLPAPLGLAAGDRARPRRRRAAPLRRRRASTPPSSSRYLALAAAFLTVTGVMVGLKRRLVDAEARQREIANLDPLTGIANRRAFDSALRRELAARLDPQNGRREGDREPVRAARLRPRRLQGDQRRLRPPGRRRGPAADRRGGRTASCAPPTSSPGSAATSSR